MPILSPESLYVVPVLVPYYSSMILSRLTSVLAMHGSVPYEQQATKPFNCNDRLTYLLFQNEFEEAVITIKGSQIKFFFSPWPNKHLTFWGFFRQTTD